MRKQEADSRSLIIDLATQNGDSSIASVPDVLLQGLLDKLPVNANGPIYIQSVGRKESGGGVDSIREVGVWNGTQAFQSVRSRSTPSGLNQLVIDRLMPPAIGLVEGSGIG